ncbi:MAG: iron-containing alcohol dehydrogenase, partial [Alphaproteobacteria bacterium]
ASLRAAGRACDSLVLPAEPRPKPLVETTIAIAERVADAIPIAVGSGVISDLVKRAARIAGTPYVAVATAASMDGYAASGAALQDGAFKRTLPCDPPVAIVADLDVVAAAPAPMAAWGYGDLAGKVVAGADWLVADALGEEALAPAFPMVQDPLAGWLARPEAIAARDPQALGGLLQGLLVTGFAMQAHGSSRPASGSDHQFSHLWEMEGLAVGGVPVAHGACVGIGCIAMLALYEWLLRQDLSALDVERAAARRPDLAAAQAEVAAAFADSAIADSARAEVAAKHPTAGALRARLKRLAAQWPALRARLATQLVAPATMQARLAAAGAPSEPGAIGVGLATLARDYRRARLIRRRYTVLDLLADIGRLDEAIDALFAPGGFWGGRTLAGAA